MKQLFAILFFACAIACSKSNQTTTPPPVSASIDVKSADTSNGIMNVHISIVGASHYKTASLVIYKTDINSVDWKYPITLKDGDQILQCTLFSDASPMNYQLQIDGNFSSMKQISY